MNLGKGIFSLETDSSKFDKGIDAAEGKAKKLGGAFGKVGAVATGVMAGTVVGALSDMARAAVDDEASVIGLQRAVENSGVSWDDYSGQIEAAIKKGQELAFSDDQTRAGLQALTESTGSVEEAMKRLPAAMDFARAKGISLEQASKLLGRVSDENTKALKRYGVVLGEGADATEVLGAVQQKFGGQAEDYGASTKGSIDKVRDSIDEWKESIGASLGPAQGLVAMLPGLSAGMSLTGGAIGALTKNAKLSVPVMKGVRVAMSLMLGPIGLIILAIGALYLAWTNNWGDIQGKTKAAVAFLGDLFSGFKLLVLGIWRGILIGIAGVVNGVIGVVNGFIENYNALASKLGLPLLGKIELVTPNLEAVDAEIDRVARARTATIFANVHEQAIAGGGGTPMYHRGTSFVPRTGLALLERGEAVIPAAQNRAGAGPIKFEQSITLNYSGPGGPGVASRMAHDIADQTTELLRVQLRRLGSGA